MVIPGTTPTNIFVIQDVDVKADNIKTLEIVYTQKGKILFEKHLEEVVIDENRISVWLSQQETLLFNHEEFVKVQIAILMYDGNCIKNHNPIVITVGECLKCEVLT